MFSKLQMLIRLVLASATIMAFASSADAAEIPAKAPPPSAPECWSGFYYQPGTDQCISFPVKGGSSVQYDCHGDTGIGYTISAYTNGSSGGGIGSNYSYSTRDWVQFGGFYDKTTGLQIPATGGYGDYLKTDYSIPKKDWGGWSVGGGLEINYGTGGWGHYEIGGGSLGGYNFTPELKLGRGYGSQQYQNFDSWTATTQSNVDKIRIGLNYPFDDKPKTNEPVKTPGPHYVSVRELYGIKLGGYVKIENAPVTTFPGQSSYRWNGLVNDDSGLNSWINDSYQSRGGDLFGVTQTFTGTRPYGWIGNYSRFTGGKIDQLESGQWDEIRDAHFGDTYDISYTYDDGTEDRYSAWYDSYGNYHETYDCYDYWYDGEDEQTDYVYDGTSMTLISRTHKDWDYDAVYVHETVSSNGGITDSYNRVPYFQYYMLETAQLATTAVFESQLAQVSNSYLAALIANPAPTKVPRGYGVAPRLELPPDVVPIVGDLGGPVDIDMDIGAPYVSRNYRGIHDEAATVPNATVNMRVKQPTPAQNTAPGTPENRKRSDLGTERPLPVSLSYAQLAENAPSRDGKAKSGSTPGPAPAPATVEKPPVALKLFTNKPALPTAGGTRPLDVGFDQDPAVCIADKSGGCTITVASGERRFYGLIGDAADFNVSLNVPYTTAIVWRESDGAQPSTIEAMRQRMPSLPPEVRAKPRYFSIGDKKFSQVMLEASEFNPSPDRWKAYLLPPTSAPQLTPGPAGKSKRGDAGSDPMDSFASFMRIGGGLAGPDHCEWKQPAAYVEGQPLAAGNVNARELRGATLHVKKSR